MELVDLPDPSIAEAVDPDVGVRIRPTGGEHGPVALVLEDELVGFDALVHCSDLEPHLKEVERTREIRTDRVLALDPPGWIGEALRVHEVVGPRVEHLLDVFSREAVEVALYRGDIVVS